MQFLRDTRVAQLVFSLLLFWAVECTASCGSDLAHSPEFLQFLQNSNLNWTAGFNRKFDGWTLDDVRHSLIHPKYMQALYRREQLTPQDMPTEFDWRTYRSKCIHPVLDQGECGSCWAFGATEALSDRFCIQSSGKIDVVLSPQTLVSCDSEDGGCNGGEIPSAWDFLWQNGALTTECEPYISGHGQQATCPHGSCPSGCCALKFYFSGKPYTIDSVVKEIYTKGPIEAGMDVYSSFMHYKGGVYDSNDGDLLGGHAIELIGFGTSNGTNYFIAKNSWGTDWGMEGYFMIKRDLLLTGGLTVGLADLKRSYYSDIIAQKLFSDE